MLYSKCTDVYINKLRTIFCQITICTAFTKYLQALTLDSGLETEIVCQFPKPQCGVFTRLLRNRSLDPRVLLIQNIVTSLKHVFKNSFIVSF